jgi:hypothetical protein
MPSFPPILASPDDATFKIIFWVIVGVIWAIASAVGAIKNKIKQAQKRAAAGLLPIDLTPRMEVKPPALPRPQQQMAWQMNVPSALASRGPAPRQQQQQKKATRPPPLRPVATPSARRPPPQLPTAPPIQRSAAATAASSSQAVARSRSEDRAPLAVKLAATLRPQSLRTQWLLTEILNKPLSLRDDFQPPPPPPPSTQ